MTLTIKVCESELSLRWHTGLAKECLDTAKVIVKLVRTEDTWFQVVCIVFTADGVFGIPQACVRSRLPRAATQD